MSDGTTTWSYTYNADGLRTSRTNGTTTYEYTYNGGRLTQMTMDENGTVRTLYFVYDADGPYALNVASGTSSTTYYYVKNAQGDITAIVNKAGTAVVEYFYDAWGNLLKIDGDYKNGLGIRNPLRYRGYVYDTETGLYYVSSRYYDPELGRFINADTFVSTGQGILGNNMFAYCRNSPVFRIDISGTHDVESNTTNLGVEEDNQKGIKVAGNENTSHNRNTALQTGASNRGSATNGGGTTIYRYGYAEGGVEKLVPSDYDVKHQDVSGLSFSTKPKPGSGMTTIEDVNSTGVLYVVVDGRTHVSIYPVGATLAQWQAAGINSIWTQALVGVMRTAPVKEVTPR